MNMNFNYPTTMYESILAPIYVFLVLFTSFAFYHEMFFSKNRKKYFSTRNKYIWAEILSYIVANICNSYSCKFFL